MLRALWRLRNWPCSASNAARDKNAWKRAVSPPTPHTHAHHQTEPEDALPQSEHRAAQQLCEYLRRRGVGRGCGVRIKVNVSDIITLPVKSLKHADSWQRQTLLLCSWRFATFYKDAIVFENSRRGAPRDCRLRGVSFAHLLCRRGVPNCGESFKSIV